MQTRVTSLKPQINLLAYPSFFCASSVCDQSLDENHIACKKNYENNGNKSVSPRSIKPPSKKISRNNLKIPRTEMSNSDNAMTASTRS